MKIETASAPTISPGGKIEIPGRVSDGLGR
jgi:hypothetical protein